jgi:hypothetical protein
VAVYNAGSAIEVFGQERSDVLHQIVFPCEPQTSAESYQSKSAVVHGPAPAFDGLFLRERINHRMVP